VLIPAKVIGGSFNLVKEFFLIRVPTYVYGFEFVKSLWYVEYVLKFPSGLNSLKFIRLIFCFYILHCFSS